MTKTVTSIGAPVMLSRVRKQACATDDCVSKSRMAIVMPLLDIEEDGGPGLGCVILCGTHLEEALVRLVNADRQSNR